MLIQRYRPKGKTETRPDWEIDRGDLILVEPMGRRPSCAVGIFVEPIERKRERPENSSCIRLENPYYRFSVSHAHLMPLPSVFTVSDTYDCVRCLRTTDQITVGSEAIVQRMLEIHSSYSVFAEFVRSLDRKS